MTRHTLKYFDSVFGHHWTGRWGMPLGNLAYALCQKIVSGEVFGLEMLVG